jgi:hypothetical protein
VTITEKDNLMKLRNSLIIVLCLLLSACGGKNKKEKIDINSLLNEGKENNLEISAESMNAIIESIPSPLEIAMVIKQSGVEFNEKMLNDQENASRYTTDQEKALCIGVYGGDLGYINIYEKAYMTVNYLTTIKSLADDINIGQFFDFNSIKRMASNNDKMDSLIYLSTINFNKMDAFLRSQKRSNLSILMVTGTWTEGLYIASKVAIENKNKEVVDWVGYQKIIIDQLILGLSAYKNDEYFQKIVTDLKSLKAVYNGITITYDYHEPESVEVDGRLVIVDKSTSTVNITEAQLNQIGELVTQIRSRLVKNV